MADPAPAPVVPPPTFLGALLALLKSRKVLLALAALVSMIAAKYGLSWPPELILGAASPFLAVILGIAHEDAGAKSAGAGITKTTTLTSTGAVETGTNTSALPTMSAAAISKLVADAVAQEMAAHRAAAATPPVGGALSDQIGVDYARVDENKVDQKAVKAAGVSFEIIRSIYGRSLDTTYTTEAPKARAVGIDVGAYVFPLSSVPIDTTISLIAASGSEDGPLGDLPTMIDIEFPGAGIAATGKTADQLLAFYVELVRRFRERFGYWPGIYSSVRVIEGTDVGSLNIGRSKVDPRDLAELGNCPFWEPRYRMPERSPALGDDASELAAISAHAWPAVPKIWGGKDEKPWLHQDQGDAKGFHGFSSTVDVDRFAPLRKGDTGARVVYAQRRLGQVEGQIGVFDDAMVESVKRFQSLCGLQDDAVIGVKTFARLARRPGPMPARHAA